MFTPVWYDSYKENKSSAASCTWNCITWTQLYRNKCPFPAEAPPLRGSGADAFTASSSSMVYVVGLLGPAFPAFGPHVGFSDTDIGPTWPTCPTPLVPRIAPASYIPEWNKRDPLPQSFLFYWSLPVRHVFFGCPFEWEHMRIKSVDSSNHTRDTATCLQDIHRSYAFAYPASRIRWFFINQLITWPNSITGCGEQLSCTDHSQLREGHMDVHPSWSCLISMVKFQFQTKTTIIKNQMYNRYSIYAYVCMYIRIYNYIYNYINIHKPLETRVRSWLQSP